MAYLRASKDEQTLSPEAQRAAIEAWAAREGVAIVDWKAEHVSGAADLEDRGQLEAAVASLREHGAGVLVVAKRDRMARDVTKARAIAGEDGIVRAAGAVVRSADGMSDLPGATGKLSTGMLDLFAEHERDVIRERTQAALDVKRARGEAVGPPPFGFRAEPIPGTRRRNGTPVTRLVPEPLEQRVIREVARLRAADATEMGIVDELAARGMVSRSGNPLTQTQVHRICRRLRTDLASHADSDSWRLFVEVVAARAPGVDATMMGPRAVAAFLRALRDDRGWSPSEVVRAARVVVSKLRGARPDAWPEGFVHGEIARELGRR